MLEDPGAAALCESPHALYRRASGSRIFATPPRTILGILGHSQIALTMDTYSQVMPVMQREAAALMDGILAASG